MRKLAVTIVLLAACGGSDSISFEGYPAAARDSLCQYLTRCGDFESEDACHKANLTPFFFYISASEQAALKMNKSKFNGGDAATCLDTLADRSCDVTSQSNRVPPDACRTVFTGTLHDGAACGLDAECISRSCNVPVCAAACCMGTCAGDTAPVIVKAGASCEINDCDASSFCDRATLMCTALQPAGGPCGDPDECQFGLDCDPSGMCSRLPGQGESCASACRDEGMTCSSTSHTCVKAGLVGASCGISLDCAPFYRCDETKHCSAGIKLGMPCAANQHCADDRAFCDIPDGQSTGMCARPRANGGSCANDPTLPLDPRCDSLYCDPTTLQCAAEPVCI